MECLRRLAIWYLRKVGVPDKKIEKLYTGQKTPVYSELYDIWIVDTDHGVEYGDIDYVMNEFTRSGVRYHFTTKWCPNIEWPDHEHTFSAVLSSIADDPENFSYHYFDQEYSLQEIEFIEDILAKYREIGKS